MTVDTRCTCGDMDASTTGVSSYEAGTQTAPEEGKIQESVHVHVCKSWGV